MPLKILHLFLFLSSLGTSAFSYAKIMAPSSVQGTLGARHLSLRGDTYLKSISGSDVSAHVLFPIFSSSLRLEMGPAISHQVFNSSDNKTDKFDSTRVSMANTQFAFAARLSSQFDSNLSFFCSARLSPYSVGVYRASYRERRMSDAPRRDEFRIDPIKFDREIYYRTHGYYMNAGLRYGLSSRWGVVGQMESGFETLRIKGARLVKSDSHGNFSRKELNEPDADEISSFAQSHHTVAFMAGIEWRP